jgi:hypothetical protein
MTSIWGNTAFNLVWNQSYPSAIAIVAANVGAGIFLPFVDTHLIMKNGVFRVGDGYDGSPSY